MTINTESVRWASVTETDPLTGLSNKSVIPTEYKDSGAKANQPIPRQWINNQFNEIYNALVDTQSQLDAIVGGSSQPTLEAIYPVDSLYMSFNTTDPATALGFGTWVAIEGKFLVGVDSGDTDYDTPLETGGAKSHTHTDNLTTDSDGAHTHTDTLSVDGHSLTVAELPSDNPLTLTVTNTGSGSTDSGVTYPLAGDNVTSTTSDNNVNWGGLGSPHSHGLSGSVQSGGDHTHNISGGVQSSDNLPPFIAVSMWRRTA